MYFYSFESFESFDPYDHYAACCHTTSKPFIPQPFSMAITFSVPPPLCGVKLHSPLVFSTPLLPVINDRSLISIQHAEALFQLVTSTDVACWHIELILKE